MFHTINEFLSDWEIESNLTLKVFENLTDESLNKPIPGYRRTAGNLAWHIIGSITEMMKTAGTKISGASEDDEQPLKVSQICREYDVASKCLACELRKNWTDEKLNDEIDVYGETWSKEFVLRVIVAHQIHHRAQLTVLMSIAGLKVPGIYGPSYIDWVDMGREPLK
jgi:uncharacterized damage-inducible protein DinB